MYLEAEEMRFIREWSVYAEPKQDIRRLETGRMTKAGTMSRYKWILFTWERTIGNALYWFSTKCRMYAANGKCRKIIYEEV